MKFIGDFHIHSHYSVATSKDLIPEYLNYWAGIKGIKVVGTGDFTHPGWLKELKEKLEPAEQGLFRLKPSTGNAVLGKNGLGSFNNETRFLLTAEISSIYKKNGKVRKVHNLIFSPDFETAERMQNKLSKIGNITSDGRPILGLDSRDLLEIALECSDNIFFVPSHIWTPWFSALGAKSGFDSIEECYDDLSKHIFAVETGLSSDPPMNWMCSFLDKYTLISNSDAHSPEKLGREANLFNTELSYNAITNAIKSSDSKGFLGTVEFFPQEGKYHYDGHRKCDVVWNPVETLRNNEICPVCGKKVIIGVMNRVVELADRDDITQRENRPSFYSLIPLKEILSEITELGPNSKQVTKMYNTLVQRAGSEFALLLDLDIKEIKKIADDILSEAIRRMRDREVYIKEGFDGEYGQIKVFKENELKSFGNKELLFNDLAQGKPVQKQRRNLIDFDLEEYRRLKKNQQGKKPDKEETKSNILKGLNGQQKKAAEHFLGPALIIAGPGTGKTHVLTYRIVNLVKNRSINPENILAVTFTNKAADEMKERLTSILEDKTVVPKLTVSTFHSFGLSILKEYSENTGRNKNFSIIDEDDKEQILPKNIGCEKKQVKRISDEITNVKQNLKSAEDIKDKDLSEVFKKYEVILKKLNLFDLDDLIYRSVKLFTDHPEVLSVYRKKYQWIIIDEYQDINFAQYQMIRMLMPEYNSNLCVIGDPNQAIYGFRGADIKFINKFVDDYPGALVYNLKKSYRCTESILRASSRVITRLDSAEREGKHTEDKMLEGLQKGIKINIAENATDKSEAEFVARAIEKMLGGLSFFSIDSKITEGEKDLEIDSLSDFAVLCRIKSQMPLIQKAFNDHNIPYQTVGNVPFFRQEPVRFIIDILKLYKNPQNNFLKERLTEEKIISYSEITNLNSLMKDKSVRDIIALIIDKYFSHDKPKDETLFKKLLDLADDFKDNMGDFLKFTALGTGIDTYKPNIENVTIMTLHAAKGLEFRCVFIVGCEEGLLPYSLFEGQESDFDEERRLLYVGMTRAEKLLFLSHSKKRFILGREYQLRRSPFIDNIEKELMELSKSEYKKKEKKEDNQLSLF
ncbi:MAG: UvrD-helicase domain-containing protein [Elusimicrobia bacterium]|nr:UvrD-helicase domain-containing protein [Elusimicrobiota bacterium]